MNSQPLGQFDTTPAAGAPSPLVTEHYTATVGAAPDALGLLLDPGTTDIETLALEVLLETAADHQRDLTALLEQMRARNAAKQRLRTLLGRVRNERGRTQGPREYLELLDEAEGALRNQLDSVSEMGEMETLRLQMAMDRMSKFMSTLSNILKKVSDTQQSLTANLK